MTEDQRGPKQQSWRSKPGCLPVAAGIGLVVIGVPMLVCPGPGIASIVLGLSLIGVGLGIRRPKAGGDSGTHEPGPR